MLLALTSLGVGLESVRQIVPGPGPNRAAASLTFVVLWALMQSTADGVTLMTGECALLVWLMLLPAKATSLLLSNKSKASGLQATETAAPLARQVSVLSDEEARAAEACKRIIAKARKKFLDANGGFVPMASAQVQSYMDASYAKFKTNLVGDTSSEGVAWTLANEDKKREIQIYSAPFKGSTARWKVVAILPGELEPAYDAVFDPEVRRKWDPMVKDIRMLQINDVEKHIGDGMAVTTIVTEAAAGGLVKSRTLLDFGLQRTNPKGGIHIANCSVPDTFPEYSLGPKPGSDGMIRAISHVGSGCSLQPIPGRPGALHYVLVSTIDLNGWLMPSVVNAAMSTSLMQGTVQMQEYLKHGAVTRRASLVQQMSPRV